MNDNSTNNNNQPDFFDRHSERQQRRAERRAARASGSYSGAWIGGVILIGLGLILLLQNMGIFYFANWWALFILLPAVAAFGTAWRVYQYAGGHLTAAARGSLFGGLILTAIAATFLFNLNLSIIGPVVLMVAGIGLILNFVVG